ncbi:MAG: multidrug efflux SMR transporter [Bacillota bacterium]
MSWLYLFLAIVFEVSGTTSMKISCGFTRLIPSLLIFLFYGFSLVFLTLALKRIDVGTAYAVWSGMGTALIATVGILWFREPVTASKVAFLGMIVVGVVGLHFAGNVH